MVLRQLEVRPIRNVLKPLLKLAQGSSHDWLWGWSPEKPPHQVRRASVSPKNSGVKLIAGGVFARLLPGLGLRNAQ